MSVTEPTSGPLTGRHALITGGGRGIGAAIARRLADDGARLTLVGRGQGALSQTAAALSTGTHTVRCNVTDRSSVITAFASARKHNGPIDILVNNAGQAASAPLAKTSDALWHEMISVNLTGTFICMREAVPAMVAAGHGRIINIASTAALRGYAYVSAYTTAKHGVVGLTRAVALEVATTGVTVNAVCPGFCDTALLREAIAAVVRATGRSEDASLAEFVQYNPQGHLVEPAHVAETVAWLCSDGAQSVTGQAISVSGGEVMVG